MRRWTGGGFLWGLSLLLGRSSESESWLERRGAERTSLSRSVRRRFSIRRFGRGISPRPGAKPLVKSLSEGSFFSYLVFSKCVKAALVFDSAPLVGGSGVASESAFAGDDCSGPDEKSVSIVLCGVRGCSKDGLRNGCGCGSFVGESKKLAEPLFISSSVDILKYLCFGSNVYLRFCPAKLSVNWPFLAVAWANGESLLTGPCLSVHWKSMGLSWERNLSLSRAMF